MGQQEVPVRALIQVAIMPTGEVQCTVQGQNVSFVEALGALEVAKGLLMAKQQAQAKAPKIVMASPALVPHVNGTRQG